MNKQAELLDSNRLRGFFQGLSKTESIKKWDLGASCSNDLSVQVDRGQAKQLKGSQRSSITVRVWNRDGKVGVTSTTDLSDSGLEKAFRGAAQSSHFGNSLEIPEFSPLSTSPLPDLVKPIYKHRGIKYLFELLRSSEQALIDKHASIKTVPYNGLAESDFKRVYINSEGAFRHMEGSYSSIYLYARAQEPGKKPRSSGAVRQAHGVEALDINGCVEEAAVKTINHLNYQRINTGSYLVCFSPEAFLELIGAFSSMFNARSVIDGLSLSNKDSIGTQISVPFLSIYDDGLHPANYSSCSFDGEGTPTKKLCLVNQGILESFLHSEATARKLGVSPTGHAGLGAKASVGPDWLVISRSNTSSFPINNSLNHASFSEKYILIENLNALHAGVKSSQGSFSLPFDGWLVNGREKVSIEAATVAGDIQNVLNSIIEIEQQSLITHQGISPHVWVDNLVITGEE